VVLDAQQVAAMKHLLIVSDGRKGHENQSAALAKYLNLPYEIVRVNAAFVGSKLLGYAGDKLKMHMKNFVLEQEIPPKPYVAVIGTGSSTYYAVKYLAKAYRARSIVTMLPRGYRYDFDLIFAQTHDNPPSKENIIEIPANFAYVEPQGIYRAYGRSIGIVIGGDNGVFTFDKAALKAQLDRIVSLYSGYEIAVTTSPRTPKEIEELIVSYGFDYEVIYSQKAVNPIPDFLAQCERVFITADSTSMISEAISFGEANVEILPLQSTKANKFEHFIAQLESEGYVHLFDGTPKEAKRKIDFGKYLEGVRL
jgi:mitochondrial fission protein ELM1